MTVKPDMLITRGLVLVGILAFLWLGLSIGEDFVIPTLIVGAALTAYLSKTEVGRAVAHRIRHGPEALEAPGEVFAELDDLRNRVLELEERVDFAERLLAQPREAEPATRIAEPGS